MSAMSSPEPDDPTSEATAGVTAKARPPGKARLVLTWISILAALALAIAAGMVARQPPHPDMWRPIGNWEVGRWDWWAYPLERNAFKRMVVAGTLSGVHVSPDGSHIWAVGSGGLILHSADGGKNWEEQNPRVARDDAPKTASSFSLISSAHAKVAPSKAENKVEAIPSQASKASPKKGQPPSSATGTAASDAAPADRPESLQASPSAIVSLRQIPIPMVVDRRIADLRAVVFVDKLRGWAVGQLGTILATTNGGATWVPQSTPVAYDLRAISVTSDGRAVWSVGSDGSMVISVDEGQSWRLQHIARTGQYSPTLNAVHVDPDGNAAWVAGAKGRLWRIDVRQNSLSRIDSQALPDTQALWFSADGRSGFAAGRGGDLASTSDSGKTWAKQELRTEFDLTSLSFSRDGTCGVVIGARGFSAFTADSGKTWTPPSAAPQFDATAVSASADGRSAWAVGPAGTLLHSRDAGNWELHASGTKSLLKDVCFDNDGQTGIALGLQGSILRTTDGGATWSVRDARGASQLSDLACAWSQRRAWAVGAAGSILRSSDGGDQWEVQRQGDGAFLTSVSASSDGERVWVGAVNALQPLLTSSDGGQTWTATEVAIAGEPASAQSRTRIPIWNVRIGEGDQPGYLLTRSGVLRQSIGGQPWQRVLEEDILVGTLATAGSKVWLAKSNGGAFASADAGQTWSKQDTRGSLQLTDVTFLADGTRGWMTGGGGTLLSTRDGGRTWNRVASGTRSMLTAVHMSPSGANGVAVGHDATMIGTTDGGQSWSSLARYSRGLPPFTIAALLVASSLLAVAIALGRFVPLKGGSASKQDGAMAKLLADRPLTDLRDDRLGHGSAVRALLKFMVNKDTEPRLTVAISAPWGMGKSSIMGMLSSGLRRKGFRSAWFNAWHHQQEGRQLSALFNVIRRQAVPSIFAEPIAAIRVRARLIWARGWFYRLGIPLLVAPLITLLIADVNKGRVDGSLTVSELVHWNFSHHWLNQPRVGISGNSLRKLNPYASAASAPPSADQKSSVKTVDSQPPKTSVASQSQCQPAGTTRKADAVLRDEVFCYLKRAVVLQADGAKEACGVKRPLVRGETALNRHGLCIFENAEQLFNIADASISWPRPRTVEEGADPARYLLPSERKAISEAAEVIEPPSLMPTIEHFVPLLALLGLFLTKGISVYGLQLLAPLQALLSGSLRAEPGAEPTGTVERYRTEFRLLTEALDGRLVVFIDDLDRCGKATVNGILEMTNYLVDQGKLFIVIGADMELVKESIEPNITKNELDRIKYQNQYLRKLVHIELPVPVPTDSNWEALVDGQKRGEKQVSISGQQKVVAAVKAAVSVLWSPLMVALVLLMSGWMALSVWHDVSKAPQSIAVAQVAPKAASQVNPIEPRNSGSRIDPAPSVVAASAPASSAVGMFKGDAGGVVPWPLAAVALALLAVAIWTRTLDSEDRERFQVALGGAARAVDSEQFMTALKLWKPAVLASDATPRGLKRFSNRARLFAIYQSENDDAASAKDVNAEAHVVALTALHHVSLELWQNLASALERNDSAGVLGCLKLVETKSESAVSKRLSEIMSEHVAKFGPIQPADVARFQALLKNVSVR